MFLPKVLWGRALLPSCKSTPGELTKNPKHSSERVYSETLGDDPLQDDTTSPQIAAVGLFFPEWPNLSWFTQIIRDEKCFFVLLCFVQSVDDMERSKHQLLPLLLLSGFSCLAEVFRDGKEGIRVWNQSCIGPVQTSAVPSISLPFLDHFESYIVVCSCNSMTFLILMYIPFQLHLFPKSTSPGFSGPYRGNATRCVWHVHLEIFPTNNQPWVTTLPRVEVMGVKWPWQVRRTTSHRSTGCRADAPTRQVWITRFWIARVACFGRLLCPNSKTSAELFFLVGKKRWVWLNVDFCCLEADRFGIDRFFSSLQTSWMFVYQFFLMRCVVKRFEK